VWLHVCVNTNIYTNIFFHTRPCGIMKILPLFYNFFLLMWTCIFALPWGRWICWQHWVGDTNFMWARHESNPLLGQEECWNILCLDNTATDFCPPTLALSYSYVVTVRMTVFWIKFGWRHVILTPRLFISWELMQFIQSLQYLLCESAGCLFVTESTTVYSLWGFILMTECDWDVKYCNVWNNSSVQM